MSWQVIDSVGSASAPSPQQDYFLQDIYSWTGTTNISNGSYLNLCSLAGVNKQAGGTAGTTLTAGNISFPAKNKLSQVIFSFRLNGTIGGASGTPRQWLLQIRRPDAVTVVASTACVKVDDSTINNRDEEIVSFTSNASDLFTTQGIQLGIHNVSGQLITGTSLSLRIQRIVNPE